MYLLAAVTLAISVSLSNYSCGYFATTKIKDPVDARIERGTYVVNVLCNCMHCHADRDFTKYAGPVVPGTKGKGGEQIMNNNWRWLETRWRQGRA